MQTLQTLFITLLVCATLVAADKPNIVFILVDDFGYMDIGANNPRNFYETPNIDALAKRGMRFTDGYAACTVCSPTRASILTGKYPQRTGVTDFIGAHQPENWKRPTPLLPARYAAALALGETTLAETFKAQGYATFFAGKWHLGPPNHWPEDQGFDINMGGCSLSGPWHGNKYFSPYANPRLADGPPGEHLPDRLATETAGFINANKEKPFFAYLSFYSVHTPLMAREDLKKKYEAKAAALKNTGPRWGREREREVRLVQDHAVYAGMVEAMDQAVGKVLQAIDDSGVSGKTIIVFPHYGNQGGAPYGAVRSGDWKLIEWYEDMRVELYDLKNDIGEQHDLTREEPAKAAELKLLLNDWRKQVNALMPTPNPNFKGVE